MQKPTEYPNINWLSDEDYKKLVGQYRLQLNGLFRGFTNDRGLFTAAIAGMDVSEFLEEIIKLTEAFGLQVRGVDKPMILLNTRGNVIR